MRYWIYWNELIQGPFELEELISLRAFGDDLLVCMEDRAEWIPASRVADLAPIAELARSRRRTPPPPPPPKEPPARCPLQGEFFGDVPEQWTLFDLQSNGFKSDPPSAFVFRPADEPASPEPGALPPFTMPIRFAPVAKETIVFTPPPSEAPPAEKKKEQAPAAAPPVPVRPAGDRPAPVTAAPAAPPVRDITPPPAPPIREAPPPAPSASVALSDGQRSPAPSDNSAVSLYKPVVRTIRRPQRRMVDVEQISLEAAAPSRNSTAVRSFDDERLSLEREISRPSKTSVFPWVIGLIILIFFMVMIGHFILDHWTSHSAIAAAMSRSSPAIGSRETLPLADHAPAGSESLTPSSQRITQEPPADVRTGAAAPASKSIVERPHAAHPTPRRAKPARKEAAPAERKPKKKTGLDLLAEETGAAVRDAAKSTPPPPTEANVPEAAPNEPGPAASAVVVKPPAMPAAIPMPVPSPGASAAAAAPTVDPWAGRQLEAINLTKSALIVTGKTTVGAQAKVILEQMHDKELLHAADSGERLYLPDKLDWTALHQEKSLYRVYLNYSALQANGERAPARTYSFIADLAPRTVSSDDVLSRQVFLDATSVLVHRQGRMAREIDQLLGAVDLVNKQKVNVIIVRKSRHNKTELLNVESSLAAAEAKLKRMVMFFRTQYPESMLQNVSKAYLFTSIIKG